MAFYGYLTKAGREKVITREQTGAASEMTLAEQVEFLDGEIKKAQSWIAYYSNPRAKSRLSETQVQKQIASYQGIVDGFAMKREVALAKLYASNMPDIGGALLMAKSAVQYPPELLAARRASFVADIQARNESAG